MNRYSIPETLAVSDSGFLFLASSGETFTLNIIGREIFRMMQNGSEEKEIFKQILEEYDIDRSSFEKDLNDFKAQLQKYSIIKEI